MPYAHLSVDPIPQRLLMPIIDYLLWTWQFTIIKSHMVERKEGEKKKKESIYGVASTHTRGLPHQTHVPIRVSLWAFPGFARARGFCNFQALAELREITRILIINYALINAINVNYWTFLVFLLGRIKTTPLANNFGLCCHHLYRQICGLDFLFSFSVPRYHMIYIIEFVIPPGTGIRCSGFSSRMGSK